MMFAESAPVLLTPGPLTTTRSVKEAMLWDWGSWDGDFRAMTAAVRRDLVEIAGGGADHTCVPLQGSGTFAVEAAVGTLVPRGGRLLVLVNGAYGKRMARAAEVMGRAVVTLDTPETVPPPPAEVAAVLAADPAITHVGLIHCETSTGILNPLEEIAAVVARAGRGLIVDAMSSFGALPVEVERLPAQAVVASSNKALQGVPGLGFVIVERAALEASAGNAHSLSLDLFDQWSYMEKTGQFRFTPPTHVVAALARALAEHRAEGGVAARGARYRRNMDVLLDGMAGLGFVSLLPRERQAPVIATFLTPADPNYRFQDFYDGLKREGFIIYPGKTTDRDTFRMGCIGAVDEADMRRAVAAVATVLDAMGVRDRGPGTNI